MGKKILFALVLASLLAGGISAQEKRGQFDLKAGPTPQKNAVFVDFGTTLGWLLDNGFGIGAGYERPFGSSFSGLVNASFGQAEDKSSGSFSYMEFGGDINARWYPFSTALDKLFINAGLGFAYRGYKFKSGYGDSKKSYSALIIPLYAGWKFIFGKHFFLEPGIGYTVGIPLSKPKDNYSWLDYNPGGLGIGLKLGWAF